MCVCVCVCVTLCWLFVVLVCVCAGQRISLSALARSPYNEHEDEISHETGRGGRKEGPREDKERRVDKGEQKRTVGLR